ncbi:Probable RNA-directed DNA polymerase from transposon X-element [Eumeta japonica]|uniref:Probable RNA-directed DNA polymerase from transposon X-element n=1 Tax=Eumeta variegata TaxID=151549 RepID=A0A4C1Y8U9_EUMVA|nr:Probable RNA-directed DNA polymerase from transposon X-element [Eumeta japonica]
MEKSHKAEEIPSEPLVLEYVLAHGKKLLTIDREQAHTYNSVLKPVWTYGMKVWSSATKSNIRLQQVQNCILRTMDLALWFTTNDEIHEYLNVPTVATEIEWYRKQYTERQFSYQNPLIFLLPQIY